MKENMYQDPNEMMIEDNLIILNSKIFMNIIIHILQHPPGCCYPAELTDPSLMFLVSFDAAEEGAC